MRKFLVRLLVERIAEGIIYAENEEEARKQAKSWNNIWDEETESEKILAVIELKEADWNGCWESFWLEN